MVIRGLTEQDGFFKQFDPDMKESNLREGTMCAVVTDGVLGFYLLAAVATEGALSLDNGLFANPFDTGGSGGMFKAESYLFNQKIVAGQTGILVTLGTAGKITKLTHLVADLLAQSGISIEVDGVEVLPPQTLSDNTPLESSGFLVASFYANTSVARTANVIEEIWGEFIVIKKDEGNIGSILTYSTQTGEFV